MVIGHWSRLRTTTLCPITLTLNPGGILVVLGQLTGTSAIDQQSPTAKKHTHHYTLSTSGILQVVCDDSTS